MSIRGRFKRSIQRLFLGDLVIDPEEYIKKIVDVLEKEYPEYWKASNLNSKKDSFWDLTKSWSEIKDNDTLSYEDKRNEFKEHLGLSLDEMTGYGIWQFMLYYLDKVGIVEHGSSIGGCYLTDFGKVYLSVLEEWIKRGMKLSISVDTFCSRIYS